MMKQDVRHTIDERLRQPVFHLVGETADELHLPAYVVGGYVRDLLLGRHSNDIDFVTVGNGIDLAQAVSSKIKGSKLNVFKTYGTAQVKTRDGKELEFVGARRESYHQDSRNPDVEAGTLEDDQRRRDFTINDMAIALNHENYGELVDPFDGQGDLEWRIIRTPLDPDVTFSDDPLRMMRAVRFAAQLDFDIYPTTKHAIERNAERIKIITQERITTELMKIMESDRPWKGFNLLNETGLLKIIFPELDALNKRDQVNGVWHKRIFMHTMGVLQNVCAESNNVWLRWAALLHDIGKPATKQYDPEQGWTFYGHPEVGARMVPKIFKRLKLPEGKPMLYVRKLVALHMRPIALVEGVVSDSGVRRLLFDAGDDIDDLMLLSKADATTHNPERLKRYHEQYLFVKEKLAEVEEKDRIRNFQPPIDGNEIMRVFGLKPSKEVGAIREAIKEAVLDGVIHNNHEEAYPFMLKEAAKLGLTPVSPEPTNEPTAQTPA